MLQILPPVVLKTWEKQGIFGIFGASFIFDFPLHSHIINKAGTVLTIIVGQDKIISGGNTFPLYLAGQFKNVSERLFPED